jgi:hypothetical protein
VDWEEWIEVLKLLDVSLLPKNMLIKINSRSLLMSATDGLIQFFPDNEIN